MDRENKTHSIKCIMCGLMQLFLVAVTVLLSCETGALSYDAFIETCRIGVVLVFVSVATVVLCNRGVVKPASIIMYAFCAFQFGIPMVIAIDSSYTDYVITSIPPSTLVTCSWYTLICIEVYSFGSIVACFSGISKSRGPRKSSKTIDFAFGDRELVAKVALGLFVFFGIAAYFYMLWFAQLSFSSGIAVARDVIGTNAVRNISRGLFVPAGFLYLIFSMNKAGKRRVFWTMAIYGLIGTLSGDRTESMTLIVVLAYYYGELSTVNRGSSKSKLVMVVVLALVVLSLPIVAQTRMGNSVTVESLGSQLESVFTETGYNFYSVCFQSMFIDRIHYGTSYLVSLLAMAPSSLMPSSITSFMQTNLPAYWIDDVMAAHFAWVTYGQGYSMIAESAFNFGNAGFLVIAIFGYAIQRLTQSPLSGNSLFSKYLSVVLLWSFLTIPRRGFDFMVNAIEYDVIFIVILMWLFACMSKRGKKVGSLPSNVQKMSVPSEKERNVR